MNNDNFENFISNLESIKMTSREKNAMRDRLRSFADAQIPVVSPYLTFARIAKRSVAFAFIAIFSIGSVSNLAAQGTLPGDTLYPIKIAHEEIKVAATFNKVKKIEYEIERTEKRILEAAEILESQPENAEAKEVISKEIKEQTEKVHAQIEDVKQDNPEEALELNANLKTKLKSSSEKIKMRSKKSLDSSEEIQIATEVPLTASTTEESTQDIELDIENINQENVEALVSTIIENLEDLTEEPEVVIVEELEKTMPNEEDEFTEELLEKILEEEAITSQVETDIIKVLNEQEGVKDPETTEIIDNAEKEKVINLQQEIAEYKEENDITDHAYSVRIIGDAEIIFDEAQLQEKIKIHLAAKEYFKARILLEEIKEFYLAEPIVVLPETIIIDTNESEGEIEGDGTKEIKEQLKPEAAKPDTSKERTTLINTQPRIVKESTA